MSKHDPVISVRVPAETLVAIEKRAAEQRELRSTVIRAALIAAFPATAATKVTTVPDVAWVKSKRGRPPKGERAMTVAERKRNSRAAAPTPKPKRTPRQLSPEQHQRLMRQEAADRAEALALARSRQAEAEARARAEAVTKANASDTHCPKCGRSYALVGWSHLCSPTEIT